MCIRDSIYASEFPEMMKQREMVKTKPFDESSSIDDIINTLPFVYLKTMDYTKRDVYKRQMYV